MTANFLTMSFRHGTPAFAVTLEPTAHFGEQLLDGTAGVEIVLSGFRPDVKNYAGPVDFISVGPLLEEVREIDGAPGTVVWAAGLRKPGCTEVTSGSSILTFHFAATSSS